ESQIDPAAPKRGAAAACRKRRRKERRSGAAFRVRAAVRRVARFRPQREAAEELRGAAGKARLGGAAGAACGYRDYSYAAFFPRRFIGGANGFGVAVGHEAAVVEKKSPAAIILNNAGGMRDNKHCASAMH